MESIIGKALQLKQDLDNGNLPFYAEGQDNFLDSIDPMNKDGIFGKYVQFLESAMNDKRFGQLSASRQKSIRDELNVIKQSGDSQLESILDEYGISLANARKMRNLLKSGYNYEPVLNLNTETGVSEWGVAPISDLTPEAKSSNGYEKFKMYGENGQPYYINVRGIPEQYNRANELKQEEQLRIMQQLGYGSDYDSLDQKKKTNVDVAVEENLKSVDTTGIRYHYHFSNGQIVTIDKTSGDRTQEVQQNSFPFANPITNQDDFYTEVILNPAKKNTFDRRKEAIRSQYQTLLKKNQIDPNEDKWIETQAKTNQTFNQIARNISNLPAFTELQQSGQAMSVENPERLRQLRQQFVAPPAQSRPLEQVMAPQQGPQSRPIGFGGTGTVPQNSLQGGGASNLQSANGFPSLSNVRTFLRSRR